MFRRYISFVALFLYVSVAAVAQINTERVTRMGRNAMYYEDYVVSIQYFNQVISAKPYLYEPYYLRGLAKFYLGDYKGAEADCTMAIERNPFVVTTYNIRGLARINMNNFDGAAQDYSNITRNDPDNQTIWHDLVICYLNAKQYDKNSHRIVCTLLNCSAELTAEESLSTQEGLQPSQIIPVAPASWFLTAYVI